MAIVNIINAFVENAKTIGLASGGLALIFAFILMMLGKRSREEGKEQFLWAMIGIVGITSITSIIAFAVSMGG